MAITLQPTTRSVVTDAIVDLVDAGTPPGNFQIGTTSFGTVLATITLSTTAFGSAASGVATLNGTPLQDTSADNSGTAAEWRIRNAANTVIMNGLAATSGTGSDITISTAAQNAGLNAINTAVGASGNIQFAVDSTFASILATLPLNATAFAAASAGSMAMNVSPAPTAAASASGTCTAFRFRTSGNTEIFRGSVGAGSGDISFDTNIFANGVPVTLNSFSLTLPSTDAASIGVLVLNTLTIVSGGLVELTSGSFTTP